MNYSNIYDTLVEKAKVRGLDKSKHEGYFEIHHIVPRCMGGSDEKENLVMFTAREHFVAHMLLWKIYPGNPSIVNAAWMMIYCERVNTVYSKVYNKLREEHSKAQANRGKLLVGEKNPFFGRTHSDASKEKMRQQRLGKPQPNGKRQRSKEERDKISATKKSADMQPWEHPTVINNEDSLFIWKDADFIYDLWTRIEKPKFVTFSHYYNSYYNKEYPPTKMKILIERLADGWIPCENPSWLIFKEGYERT